VGRRASFTCLRARALALWLTAGIRTKRSASGTDNRLIRRRQRQKRWVTDQFNGSTKAAEYLRSMMNGSSSQGRFFRRRCELVQEALASCAGGDILDAACGAESVAKNVFESRSNAFRVTLLDQSPEMVALCASRLRSICTVEPVVGELEALPFPAGRFDVAICVGSLDYTEKPRAISELSRVTREGGLVVATMLNPLNPTRLAEWMLWWPSQRLLGAIERMVGVPAAHRHASPRSGIRSLSSGALRRLMKRTNLEPIELIFFDLRLPVPSWRPFSLLMPKVERIVVSSLEERDGRPSRALRCVLGSAYLVVARRVQAAGHLKITGATGRRGALGQVALPTAWVR
jgi:ubiquinone/menaquinone biosynthesis C-methylase UbiE